MAHPTAQPALFLSHGAAIYTTDPKDPTCEWLRAYGAELRRLRPSALLVVSAHYEAHPVRVTASQAPPTLHDHPVQALYATRYAARGNPALARQIRERLAATGIACEEDPERGLDHGAWVPLSLLVPEQDIPVVQLSLLARGSPQEHVALGEALAPLRQEGVLLVGSGGVTHDQGGFRRGYFSGGDPYAPPAQELQAFESWVEECLVGLQGRARTAALARYREHPQAARAHPTEEHFLPLLVVAAAGGEGRATRVFTGSQHGLSTSAFLIG
jgi:4,5-DOPA dioxygenase extradiol